MPANAACVCHMEAVPAVLDLWECIDLFGYVICIDNMAPSMRLTVHYADSEWPLSLHQCHVNLQLAAHFM